MGDFPQVESKSGSLSKDQLSNEKGTHNFKGVNGACIPEERMLRLSAVGEGWDKNKMKRKRSVGTVVNKSGAGDVNRTMHSELSTDSKPASSDTSFLR